ncbi:hypothetical protein CV019_02440, partial [Staphylococcus haemolyticus]
DDEHHPPAAGRHTQRGGNDAVNSVRSPVGENAQGCLGCGEEGVQVADGHTVADKKRAAARQEIGEFAEDPPLEEFLCRPQPRRQNGGRVLVRAAPRVAPGTGHRGWAVRGQGLGQGARDPGAVHDISGGQHGVFPAARRVHHH